LLVVPNGVYKWSINPFTNPIPVYIHSNLDTVLRSLKKSHGSTPTLPSRRFPRTVTLPTTAYFPIFPTSRLVILFTGMLVLITLVSLDPEMSGSLRPIRRYNS
jgi:hypothetical protein